jgi:hypothetical protein
MELILAVLGAGPIGYLSGSSKRALRIYLAAWAVVFPIQSYVVLVAENGADDWWQYLPMSAAILVLGLFLAHCGALLRRRRLAGETPPDAPPGSA